MIHGQPYKGFQKISQILKNHSYRLPILQNLSSLKLLSESPLLGHTWALFGVRKERGVPRKVHSLEGCVPNTMV